MKEETKKTKKAVKVVAENTEKKPKKEKKEKIVSNSLIKKARMTEKASYAIENGVYTFNVLKNANKTEIAKEIFTKYKVKPIKINIITIKAKEVRVRGKMGVKQGGKKALVYLKKGDKIEL